jgi:hypothetical protein
MASPQQWRVRAATGATLLGMLGGGWLAATGPAQARSVVGLPHARTAHAVAAHAVTATDTANLRYVSASGSLLFEDGRAAGTLPGSMRVHLNVGATFSGSFTIDTRGGSIKGHGEATPHGSGVYESFAGSLLATGGSGRFAHAHGRAKLYGTFNRDTYALTVQTTGTLSY